jgi:hypothetical protein
MLGEDARGGIFRGRLDVFLSGGYSATSGLSREPAYQSGRTPSSATPTYLPDQTACLPESLRTCLPTKETCQPDSQPARQPARPIDRPTDRQSTSQTTDRVISHRVTASYSYSKIQNRKSSYLRSDIDECFGSTSSDD